MRIAPFRAATPAQAGAAMDALRHVLTAGGTAPLSVVHEAVLGAVANHFFGASAAPAAGAEVPPPLCQGLAELALLMPLTDPVMDIAKVDAAATAIAGLGVALPQLSLLRDAAEGRLNRLRRRVSTPLVRQLAGVGIPGAVLQVLQTKLGLHRGHGRALQAAGSLPTGTLGRELLRYYADNPFPIPGEAGGLPPALVGRHDYLHVLTGYDTSTEGELCLSGFVGACAGEATRIEAMVTGLMQFNQAIPVQGAAAAVVTKGALDPHTYVLAIARGAACTRDVAHPSVDYLAWLGRDLEQLRQEFGIGPEGMMVNAAQPRWGLEGQHRVLGGQKRR